MPFANNEAKISLIWCAYLLFVFKVPWYPNAYRVGMWVKNKSPDKTGPGYDDISYNDISRLVRAFAENIWHFQGFAVAIFKVLLWVFIMHMSYVHTEHNGYK